MNEQTILHCEDIHKSFSLNENGGSQLDVLRGIDFEVTEGEMIAVVGASGSGKSTFLHILGGLDRPTKGNVFWQGKKITLWGKKVRKHFRNRTDVHGLLSARLLLRQVGRRCSGRGLFRWSWW